MATILPSVAQQRLETLRSKVRSIEAAGQRRALGSLPFGIESIDQKLVHGGIALSGLHEMTGIKPNLSDHAAASLFVAAIAARSAAGGGTVLWAQKRRDLFAPGLAQVGLTPRLLVQAECGRDEDVRAVMEEGLRHGGLATVVGEVGRASMTSTRRLQLAAEASGTAALMLKHWRRSDEDPLAQPSAALTRWRIGCVPSEPLPHPGIGRHRWRLELARQRGGEPHQWIMEGADAEGRLALPAEPFHRQVAAGEIQHAA